MNYITTHMFNRLAPYIADIERDNRSIMRFECGFQGGAYQVIIKVSRTQKLPVKHIIAMQSMADISQVVVNLNRLFGFKVQDTDADTNKVYMEVIGTVSKLKANGEKIVRYYTSTHETGENQLIAVVESKESTIDVGLVIHKGFSNYNGVLGYLDVYTDTK